MKFSVSVLNSPEFRHKLCAHESTCLIGIENLRFRNLKALWGSKLYREHGLAAELFHASAELQIAFVLPRG